MRASPQNPARPASASDERRRAAEAIAGALKGARCVAVVAHAYPDPDAVGSTLGLALALESAGKAVAAWLPTRIDDALLALPGVGRIQAGGIPAGPPPDLLFVLDCDRPQRTDPLYPERPDWFAGRPVVNIDHHRTNRRFGSINLVDAGVVSTASLIFELLQALGVPLAPDVAQALLTGVVGDSQSFTAPSADASALATAAALIEAGASLQATVRMVSGLELARVRYWAAVMSRMEVLHGGRVALLTTSLEEQNAAPVYDPSEGLADFLLRVHDVDLICLLVERAGGEIKGSLRTASPRLDMGQIAQRLGGGGHASRAGFSLFGLPMGEARAKALAAIAEYLGSRPADVGAGF